MFRLFAFPLAVRLTTHALDEAIIDAAISPDGGAFALLMEGGKIMFYSLLPALRKEENPRLMKTLYLPDGGVVTVQP